MEYSEECKNSSQCREVSIDAQAPLSWALPLYGYVTPAIVAITLATNSFIVAVLSHKHLRTPTNYVLLAMAVTELLTGLSCVPWLLYYYTFNGYEVKQREGLPAFWCTMFPYMAVILPSIFHTAAIWLTVYLAVQRYIYICVPKLVRSYCTFRRSKQVIATVCFLAVWIYAPDTFVTYNKSFLRYYPEENTTKRICARMNTSFLKFIGSNVYYVIIYGLHTCLVHTLPCILLVIFTWKLVRAIRIAGKRHAILLSKSMRGRCTEFERSNDSVDDVSKKQQRSRRARSSTSETKRAQGLKQNTRMLIVVILLFLVTEIPAALIFSLHLSAVTGLKRLDYGVTNKLLIVRNVLIVVSYPFRFAVYCGMSQQFREVVRNMFTKQVLFWRKASTESTWIFPRKQTLNPDIDGSDERRATVVVSCSLKAAGISSVSASSDYFDKGAICEDVIPRNQKKPPCLILDPYCDDTDEELAGVNESEMLTTSNKADKERSRQFEGGLLERRLSTSSRRSPVFAENSVHCQMQSVINVS